MLHGRIELDDPRDFLIWREGQGRTVEIYDIVVGSERRVGRGRLLVQKLLDSLPTDETGPSMVFAITRWENTVAMQFYEALGFRLVGRLHYFYRDGGWDNHHAVVYGLDR